MVGIYRIRNRLDNKIYIGSSKDIIKRFSDHKTALQRNKHENQHLQNAWNKYGEDTFEFELLILCEEYQLLIYEQLFLDNINPDYNISKLASGGDYWSGKKRPSISKLMKGNKFAKKTHTLETRKRMSGAQLGKSISKEHKELLSDLYSGAGSNSSKLSNENVLMIRRMYDTGKYSQRALGILFNVSHPCINKIINRISWKNI